MKDAYQVFPHPSLDWRLTPTRHTNTRMAARHFSTREEVDQRRGELVFNLRMAAGLYPWPEKTPLNVHGEKAGDLDGFTIEIEKRKILAWITGIRDRKYFTADPIIITLDDCTLEQNVAVAADGVQVPYIRLTPPALGWPTRLSGVERRGQILSGQARHSANAP